MASSQEDRSHRQSVTGQVQNEFQRRVGNDAAAYRMASRRWSLITLFPLGGFVLAAGILSVRKSHAIDVLLVVLWVAAMSATFMMVRSNFQYRRAVASALGIPIGLRTNRPPPSRRSDYLDWCEQVGVAPYPFDHT
jgi:hypothetical protein